MIKTASGLPAVPTRWTRALEGLTASRPVTYVCIVLAVALLGYGYGLRTHGIFACQADGYSSDRYLAYCSGTNYADFDHGAFYFGLEPSVQRSAKNADVLFLGNSRIQMSLSTAATSDWFTDLHAHYYLMGFGYLENELFTEKLLERIHPGAKVYVINVDDFFDRSETPPAKFIFHDAGARDRYREKRGWQDVHAAVCKTLRALCGDKFALFRSRKTGAYYTTIIPQTRIIPVSYDRSIDQKAVLRNTANAIDFLSTFAKGKCVILTIVPSGDTKLGNANAIASRLGMKLVTPGLYDNLRTFDGSHLDRASAERWSQAFFEAAGPRIRDCLDRQRVAHLVAPPGSAVSH